MPVPGRIPDDDDDDMALNLDKSTQSALTLQSLTSALSNTQAIDKTTKYR